MITEKNHKLLTSQLFVTDCTKKGLASMQFKTLKLKLWHINPWSDQIWNTVQVSGHLTQKN